MAVPTELVKELRERTGAGVKECRDILMQADGDINKAIELLREKGIQAAEKKVGREAKEGRVEVYIHPGSRLAAMVELNCETDFVARTEDFIGLSKEIALHIAATNPRYLKVEDVAEADIAESDMTAEKYYEENVLLAQPFVKNPSMTIEDKLKEGIAKLGENIRISRFVRYEVGDSE